MKLILILIVVGVQGRVGCNKPKNSENTKALKFVEMKKYRVYCKQTSFEFFTYITLTVDQVQLFLPLLAYKPHCSGVHLNAADGHGRRLSRLEDQHILSSGARRARDGLPLAGAIVLKNAADFRAGHDSGTLVETVIELGFNEDADLGNSTFAC